MTADRPAIVWTQTPTANAEDIGSGFDAVFAHSWAEVISRISDIRKLKDGWDGDSAKAPTREMIDSAVSLLNRSPSNFAPTSIAVTPEGSIFIEWQVPSQFASVEIRTPYVGEWLIERAGLPPEFSVQSWQASDDESKPPVRQRLKSRMMMTDLIDA